MQFSRSIFLSALLAVAFTVSARADLTIVQRVAGEKESSNVVLKIKGDLARVDINPHITTILNGKTGEMLTLMRDQQQFIRIAGDRAKAMAEMAGAFGKNNGMDKPPRPTRKTEKINGFETEEYVSDSPHLHTTYWVAKDYPDYKNILQQLTVLKKGAFGAMRRGVPDFGDLPGLPIRTEIRSGDKVEVTSTLVSISPGTVPASDFDIPAGYTEMKMPDFMGGKPSPAEPDKSGNE